MVAHPAQSGFLGEEDSETVIYVIYKNIIKPRLLRYRQIYRRARLDCNADPVADRKCIALAVSVTTVHSGANIHLDLKRLRADPCPIA
jgi:hypothetical protein